MQISKASHVVASAGVLVALAIGVGAKVALIALVVWTVVAFLAMASESRSPEVGRIPEPAILGFLALALWTALSATWSSDPFAAVRSGAALAIILFVGELLWKALKRLNTAESALVAGWFAIGFLIGAIVLLSEVASDYVMLKWLFNAWPWLRPARNSMLVLDHGWVVDVNPANGNWSVGGVNILLWPVLLIVTLLGGRRRGFTLTLILVLIVLATTMWSEHQTSMVAMFAALVVFGLSRLSPRVARLGIMAGYTFLVIAAVPLADLAYRKLELHNTSWIHDSLRGRLVVWGYVAEQVPKAPLLGRGARAEYDLQRNVAVHSHSYFIQIWYELGAVGAALLLLSGLLTIQAIGRLKASVVPFANAAALTGIVETMTTWNMWHTWVTAALVLSLVMMRLANRLVAEAASDAPVVFRDDWLKSIGDFTSRHRRAFVVALLALGVGAAGWQFLGPQSYLRLTGTNVTLDWRPTQAQLAVLRGKSVTISARMRSGPKGSFVLMIMDDVNYVSSPPAVAGAWQNNEVTLNISPTAGRLVLRFAQSVTPTELRSLDIRDMRATADGKPFELDTSLLFTIASQPPRQPRMPWDLSGDAARIQLK